MSMAEDFAYVYCQAEQWGKAIRLLELLIAKKKSILGKDHPETRRLIADLDGIHFVHDRRYEAQQAVDGCLESSKNVSGDDTVSLMESLAGIFSYESRQHEASQLPERVSRVKKITRSIKNPFTLQPNTKLATSHPRDDKHYGASVTKGAPVRASSKISSDEHPAILNVERFIALLFRWIGHPWEAPRR